MTDATTTPATPDLGSYDWIVINSSAGKDSQAMLLDLIGRCDAQGIDRAKIVVAHADLGRAEWAGTEELVRKHAAAYGLRVEVIARPQGDLLTHVEQRGMWPSNGCRYCTSDHKRGQINKILTKLARETRKAEGRAARILNCIGIRADESPARAKKTPFERNARATGKGQAKVVDNWFPIFTMSTVEVWAKIHASELPHHFAYDLGMPRLSCVFCVFAPKSALMIAGRANPKLLDEYVAVEERIGHTFRDGFAIAEVKAAIDAGTDEAAVSVEETACWNM